MFNRNSNVGVWSCVAALSVMSLYGSSAVGERRIWYIQHPSTVDQKWRANAIAGGTNNRLIAPVASPNKVTGIAIDTGNPIISYFSLTSPTTGTIARYFDDGFVSNILSSPTLRPKYLVRSNADDALYFFDDAGNDIYRIQPDGTGLVQIYSNAGDVTSMAVDTIVFPGEQSYLFWSDSSGIGSVHRINIPDGTGHMSVAASGALVATDELSNILFVRDLFGGVGRWNYNLNFVSQILPNGTNPSYMAVALVFNHLYWSNATTGEIRRADLDGDNVVTILSGLSLINDSPIALELTSNFCNSTTPYGDQDASGNITVIDVGKVVDAVKGLSTITELNFNRADIFPCTGPSESKVCRGDGFVNVQDIGRIVDLLKGVSFTCP